MVRLIAYLAVISGGLAFWLIELFLNYKDYAGNNPYGLDNDYQAEYLYNKTSLLVSELWFPMGMAVAFLLLFIFKLTGRSVRLALGFITFLCMEFWMWRAYVFDERIREYYLRDETNDPFLNLPHYFPAYMLLFAAAFLMVLFLREYATMDD
jgi:hypothetical protein